MTGMNLTLKKSDLLQELEAKRTEVLTTGPYARDIEALEEFVRVAVTEADLKTNLVAYYKDLAEGLVDGRYEVNPKGTLKSTNGVPVPAKPKVGGPSGTELRRLQRRYYVHNKEDAERQLEYVKEQRDRHLKPLDSAIKLLKMSTDTKVTIDGGDYQKLLAL